MRRTTITIIEGNMKQMENSIAIPCTEYAGIKGLWRFCTEHKLLVLATAIVFVFAYAAKLFFYNIGVDTELYLAQGGRDFTWSWWIQLGRYGLVALQRICDIFHSFDLAAANLLMGFFMICAGVLWSRLFFIFSHRKLREPVLLVFSILFTTNPIYAEMMYFSLMSAECAFAIAVCPLAVQWFFCGITQKRSALTAGGILLLTFLTAIYQSALLLFCCGVFAAFILFVFTAPSCENADKTACDAQNKALRILCVKLFIALIVSTALYFALGEVLKSSMRLENTDYFTKQLSGKDANPSLNRIVYFCIELYKMTFAKIPLVQDIFTPVMASRARTGMEAVTNIHAASLYGSVMIVPLFVLALVFIAARVRHTRCSALTILALAGMFVCAFFFPLLAANTVAVRTYWAFPLALSFLYVFCTTLSGKKLRTLLLVCAAVSCVWQVKLTSQLLVSDLTCFRHSEELARDIYARVRGTESGGDKPLILIGAWKWSETSKAHYLLDGDVLGHSVFEWNSTKENSDATRRGVTFMQLMALPVYAPDKGSPLFDAAQETAKTMPSYPAKGSVQETEGFVVVKLSETTYKPEQ